MLGIARRLTLRQRLLALVAVAIVPGLLALLVFIAAFHQERQREVREQALRTSEIIALEMTRIVSGAGAVLETLAVAPAVRTLSPSCTDYLSELAARLPNLVGFAVAEPDGRLRCATAAFASGGFAGHPFFAEAVAGKNLAVGGYSGGGPGRPAMLPLALRVDDGPGTRVLVTGVDLDWLGDRLRDRALAPGSAISVADREGIVLAREPDPDSFVGNSLSPDALRLARAGVPGTAQLVSPDGTERIVGYQPIASTGVDLYVGVGFSTDLAFAPVYRSTWRSLALAGAGAVAAFLVAWFVGDSLLRRPVRRILDTVASWRAGDEIARVGIGPEAGELSTLAAAIDEYMDGLVAVRAERAAAEERRSLLLREMNHRIKNILAAVQAIANQTFRDAGSPEASAAFSSRLAAMATAHDLLVTENWQSVDLATAVAAAVRPFTPEARFPDARARFDIGGPPLRVTAKAALTLSMALHELSTNAAKYGALTTAEGRVAVRWRLDAAPERGRFHLVWREEGGPPVTPPSRRGFGSRLIETALAAELAGSADLQYRVEGVAFVLDADATRVLADPPAAGDVRP